MPQSVRGLKRIDFSFKGNKPLRKINITILTHNTLVELSSEALNPSTSTFENKEPEIPKSLGLKPSRNH